MNEQRRQILAHQDGAARSQPWVQAAASESQLNRKSETETIAIDDVSSIIDAVQRSNSEDLAMSVLPLKEIVGSISNAQLSDLIEQR